MSGLSREQLRTLFLFEALTDQQLDRLSEQGELRAFDAGVVVTREGEPAEHFVVLVDGRIRLSRLMGGEDVTLVETDHRGAYAGATRAYMGENELYAGTLTTLAPTQFFRMRAGDFGEFVRTTFPMAVHLLDGLYVGIRNSEAQVRQREHLASLGTLSANLAHELNNPAAATVRATSQLRSRVAGMRHKLGLLAGGTIPPEALRGLVELQERAVEHAAKSDERLSPLEMSDREDEIAERLEQFGMTGPYELAAVFAGAGVDAAWLDEVASCVDPGLREGAVRWLAYTLETEALMEELEDASTRISTLVAAVKSYAHLDGATASEVDVHDGLESTVVMLGPKLARARLVTDFDRSLPKVPAHAGELNQVWTNLLDNAAGAVTDTGGTITLRTARDGDAVLVEVSDDGPGIAPEVLPRIWDAFFTTKPAGTGSGLGLDNVRRIVEQRHGGGVEVDTAPGRGTTFSVRLPLTAPS